MSEKLYILSSLEQLWNSEKFNCQLFSFGEKTSLDIKLQSNFSHFSELKKQEIELPGSFVIYEEKNLRLTSVI